MEKLGLDMGAVVFYIVNFGILAIILNKLVYKPVISNLDDRRKRIADNLSEAQKLQENFNQMLSDQKTKHQHAMDELKDQLAKSKAEAETEIANMRTQAAQERAEMFADAKKQIDIMKNQIESEVADKVMVKITDIVTHALHSNLPPDKVISSINKAWVSLKGKA